MKIKEKIRNWLTLVISDNFIDRLAFRTAYIVERDVYHKFFAAITLEELKEVVDRGFKNRKEKGETDYIDLALFFKRMKDEQIKKEEENWEATWEKFRIREEENRKKEVELLEMMQKIEEYEDSKNPEKKEWDILSEKLDKLEHENSKDA